MTCDLLAEAAKLAKPTGTNTMSKKPPVFSEPDELLHAVERSDQKAATIYAIAMAQTLALLRRAANDQLLAPENASDAPNGNSAWRNREASKEQLCRAIAASLCSDDDRPESVIALDGSAEPAPEGQTEAGDTREDAFYSDFSSEEADPLDEAQPLPEPEADPVDAEEDGSPDEAAEDFEVPQESAVPSEAGAEPGDCEAEDDPPQTCAACEAKTDRWEQSGSVAYPLCQDCADMCQPYQCVDCGDETDRVKQEGTEVYGLCDNCAAERDREEAPPEPEPTPEPAPQPKTDLAAAIANAVAGLLPAQAGSMDEERIREIATEIASDLDAQTSDTLRDWTRDQVEAAKSEICEGIKASTKKFIGDKLDEAAAAMASQVAKMLEKAQRTIRVNVPARPETTIEGDQHKDFPALLSLLAAGLNVMLVGPAGSGKTHACKSAAAALGLKFYCMSVGAQTTMSAIMGYMDANGQYVGTVFRDAFELGGVFLLDELDAGNPNVLTALNAALANGHCAFPDGMVKQHPEFRCVAAANTYGNGQDRQYVGRNQLDATSLDRFACLPWNYDESLEFKIAGFEPWVRLVQAYRLAADGLRCRHIISPRASIQGAKLCIQGDLSVAKIVDMVVFKSLDTATRNQIMSKSTLGSDAWLKIEHAATKIRMAAEKKPDDLDDFLGDEKHAVGE